MQCQLGLRSYGFDHHFRRNVHCIVQVLCSAVISPPPYTNHGTPPWLHCLGHFNHNYCEHSLPARKHPSETQHWNAGREAPPAAWVEVPLFGYPREGKKGGFGGKWCSEGFLDRMGTGARFSKGVIEADLAGHNSRFSLSRKKLCRSNAILKKL